MVTVYSIDQKFSIDIYSDPKKKKGLVQIIVQPLRYKQKVIINSQTVTNVKGVTFIDQGLSTFLTLKYSIKKILGLKDPKGKEFKLSFETLDGCEVLEDDCLEALINCELGHVLNFYAVDAITSTPHNIINPATFKILENVEFKPWIDKKTGKPEKEDIKTKKK